VPYPLRSAAEPARAQQSVTYCQASHASRRVLRDSPAPQSSGIYDCCDRYSRAGHLRDDGDFSAADAVLLHPLPYPHPEQLVLLQENLPAHNLHQIAPSPEDFAEFRRRDVFSAIAGIVNNDVTLTGSGSPEYADGARVSASLFPMLGVVPVLGSLFTSAQEQPGQDRVAILSKRCGFGASAPAAPLSARRSKLLHNRRDSPLALKAEHYV